MKLSCPSIIIYGRAFYYTDRSKSRRSLSWKYRQLERGAQRRFAYPAAVDLEDRHLEVPDERRVELLAVRGLRDAQGISGGDLDLSEQLAVRRERVDVVLRIHAAHVHVIGEILPLRGAVILEGLREVAQSDTGLPQLLLKSLAGAPVELVLFGDLQRD